MLCRLGVLESSIKRRRRPQRCATSGHTSARSFCGFTVKKNRLDASAPNPYWGLHVDRAQSVNRELNLALEHLRKALAQLDQVGAPGQIGAHIDLAVHQLQDLISGDLEGSEHSQNQIDTNAEPQ